MFASLFLALFAQQPSALELMPSDSLIVFEASREPWRRLGEGTRLHAVLGLDGVRECLAPTEEVIAELDRGEFAGAGAALWNALAYGRMWLAFPLSGFREPRMVLGLDLGPGAVFDPATIFPDAEWVERGGERFLELAGGSAWWRDGDVLLASVRFERAPGESPASEVDYLAATLAAGRAGHGLARLPGMQRLRDELAGPDDLIGLWLPRENVDLGRVRASLPPDAAGEADLDDGFALMAKLGFDRLGGAGWALSLAGADLRERILVLHPNFYGGVLRPDPALPARLAALPGDTALARLGSLDFGLAVAEILRLAEAIAEVEDETWPPDGMAEHFETARRIAAAVGPSVGFVTRADDLWAAENDLVLLLGDAWLEVRDPAAYESALARLPEPTQRLLAEGMTVRGKRLGAFLRGDRLVFAESSGAPIEARLGQQRAWLGASAPFRAQFDRGGIVAMDYAGPEYQAFLVQRLRFLGSTIEQEPFAGFPRLAALPGFDQLVHLLGPSLGVVVLREDGCAVEYRGPFGYSLYSALNAAAGLLEGFVSVMNQVGQSIDAAPEDEEIY